MDNTKLFNTFTSNIQKTMSSDIFGAKTQYQEKNGLAQKIAYAQWINDYASDIYYTAEDPRERANAKLLADSIHEQMPGVSEKYIIDNYENIIHRATGNKLNATGLMDVFGQKIAEGYKSFWAGVNAIAYTIEDSFKEYSESDEQKRLRQEQQNAYLSSISGNVRTDYYNEYDNFVQKAILGLGDTLPSLLNSAPAFIGAAATSATGVPLFYAVGKGVSDTLNFTMEFGSLVQTLRETNATPEQILSASLLYAGISTAIEHNFDKIPENLLARPAGEFLKLYHAQKGLGVKAVTEATRKVYGSVGKAITGRAIKAGTNWLSETGEEVLQQLAEDLTVNLLSDYREKHGQDALPDYITHTPEEIGKDLVDTFKQMGTTQSLISTLEMIIGLGFDVSLGDIRNIVNANKYTRRSDTSDIRFASEMLRTSNPQNVQEGVRGAIKGRATSAFGFIPDTMQGADYAGYVFGKGKRNTLYTEQNTNEVNGKEATRNQAIAIVDDIIEKDSKGNNIDVQITDDGKLKVAKSQIAEVIRSFIYSHYDSYDGISENGDGTYDVVLDGTKYTFTDSDTVNGKTVTATDIIDNLGIETAANEYDENRKKTIERRAESFRGAMKDYVAKDSDQKRSDFISSARDSLIRQGYNGEELQSQIDAVNRIVNDNERSLSDIASDFEKRGVLARGTDSNEFVRSISNGIASTVVKLAHAFGKDVNWASNTIKLDSKPIQGVYITETPDGSLERTRIWGKSYWTDGTEVDGKTRQYQDYSEIENKDKAEFHIAVSDLVDQTTGAHETAHMFLSLGSESLIKDSKFRNAFREALAKDNIGKAESEWKIGDNTHEAFAEGLEAYINNGIADSDEKVSIFKSVLNAVRDIWRSISEFLTKNQLEFYDKLLGDTGAVVAESSSGETVVNESSSVNEEPVSDEENLDNMDMVSDEDFSDVEDEEVSEDTGSTERNKSSFEIYQLSDADADKLYQNFYDSYTKSVGSSWDRQTFDYKASTWTFFGSPDGGVALRLQNSGLYKLNACYGSPKEIFNGIKSMINEIGDRPIWGAMTENLSDMMEKASGRFGVDKSFKQVPTTLAKILVPNIAKVFGRGVTVNKDGTLTAMTPAGVPIKKVLVANNSYYKYMIDTLTNNPDILPIPKILRKLTTQTLKMFYMHEFSGNNDVARNKSKTDYIKDNEYNKRRIIEGQLDKDVALERDGVYVDNLVSAMEYLAGGKYVFDRVFVETKDYNSGEKLLTQIRSDGKNNWKLDLSDESLTGNIYIYIPADMDSMYQVSIKEYLDNIGDYGEKRPGFEAESYITLPNGNNLYVVYDNPDNWREHDDSEIDDKSTRRNNMIDLGDALGTFQSTERLMWGDLKRIVDHHSHALFQDLDTAYAMTGTNSQSFGSGNYENTDMYVGQGYREKFHRIARRDAINNSEKVKDEITEEAFNDVVNPHIDAMKSELKNLFYPSYELGVDGISLGLSFPSIGENMINCYETALNVLFNNQIWGAIATGRSFGFDKYDIKKILNEMYDITPGYELIDNFASSIARDTTNAIARVLYGDEKTEELILESMFSSKEINTSSDEYNYIAKAIYEIAANKIVEFYHSNHDLLVETLSGDAEQVIKTAAINGIINSFNATVRNSMKGILEKDLNFSKEEAYKINEALKDYSQSDDMMKTNMSYFIRKAISNKINVESASQAELAIRDIYPYGITFMTIGESQVYYDKLPVPTVKYYNVITEGDDSRFLQWSKKLNKSDADKIYEALMKLGYHEGYDDMKKKRGNVWIREAREIEDTIYGEPFEDVYRMLEDIFTVNDPDVISSDKYFYAKEVGNNVEGKKPADRAVSEFMRSIGFVGHTVPNNFNMSGNREYDRPNYVTYTNEDTSTARRAEFTDPMDPASEINVTYFNEKNGRYKRQVERVSFDKDASEGRPLNYREVTRYIGESDWARAEQDASRIDADGSLQWVETELRRVIKDYLDGDRFVYSEMTDEDWEKVAKNWMNIVTQRLSKDKKKKVDIGSDPVKVARRLVVYIMNTSADSGLREWLNQYTGKNGKAGDNNMLRLARKMQRECLFDEKMPYGNNQQISRRFPYMNLILTEDRRSKKSFRTQSAEIIWERAEKEIENNARELYALEQGSVWDAQADRIGEADVDENVVVEGEYANMTERAVQKARNEAAKAREYAGAVQEEIDKIAYENETLKNNVNQMFDSLEDLADRFGIDRSEYTNLEELVDAIRINGSAYEEVTGRLMAENIQQAIDYEAKIQENNDRINELKSEMKDSESRIHDIEVENRRKQRKIDRQIEKIDELTDKLKEQKRLSEKEYSELEKKYNKAILDYASLKDKSNDVQQKLISARQKLKSIERSKENTESKLKQTEYTLIAISKALDNTFKRLEKAISEKNSAQKRLDETVEKYNTLRANTISSNARRSMRKNLEHNSGDADNQRAMRAFSKGFFQRDTEKDPFKKFNVNEQMMKALPKTISFLSGAEMYYTIKDGKNKGKVVVALDENGNVAHLDMIKNGVVEKGFSELPMRYYPFIKAAINEDVDRSRDIQKEREQQRDEKVKTLNDMASGSYSDVKLTKAQQKEADELLVNGDATDMADARKKVFEKYSKTAHEGSEALKKMQRKGFGIRNNLVFVSFESLYNIFGKINKKIRDAFFFGYNAKVTENGKTVEKHVEGINTVTDNYLKGKNKRISDLQNEVVDLLGGEGKTNKQRAKIFEQWQKKIHESVITKQLSEELIPQSLLDNETFMNLLYDEDEDGELVAKYDSDPTFVDETLTVQEVMAIYEHAKSRSTDIGHLIGERGNISPYQIAYIVDQFERADGEFHQYLDIADAYQRAYEQRFDDIARISNSVYGISLRKIDIYSPLNRADDNQDTDVSMAYMFNQNGQLQPKREGTALAQKSFQQDRAGGDSSISLQYVSDFGRVVQSQEYFIAGAEFFKLWNDILKNSGGNLRSTIQSNYGYNVADAVVKNIKACSGADFTDVAGGMNGLVNTLRNNMALANLGFSISSTLQQPAVWFLGAGKYGYGKMLSVVFDMKKKYGSIRNFIEHVHELSPQIAEMQNVQIAYAHQAMNTNGFMKGLKSVAEWGMKGIEWLDQINRCILFEAAYNYYAENKEMSETQVVEKATQDVMNMNSSRQAKDNALLYNSKSPYWKALLMFTNQLNKQWNMFIGEDGIDALHEKRIKEFIGTMTGLAFASTWVLLAKGKLVNNPGDDDKWFLDLMKDYGTEWAEMVPVVGDMFASAVNGYSYLDSNIVSSMVTLVKRVASDDKNKGSKIVTASKNVTKDFMTLIGAPKYIFSNTYNALIENGEWAGDRLFEDARILRLFMPYEWYEFFTGDK